MFLGTRNPASIGDVKPTGSCQWFALPHRNSELPDEPKILYVLVMIHDLPIGRSLRRFRRLNAMKQGHAAELLQVSQGTVSRWESGEVQPDGHHRMHIENLIRAKVGSQADAALKRLVLTSSLPVHLVCDATHELLAASPARARFWSVDAEHYVGTSLWPFASEEIMAAEAGLDALGWFERPFQWYQFETGDNGSEEIPVRASRLRWETLPLADGRVGRLTTTLSQ
jgi:transcriptional regulator with XRE-family HTH domain